MNTEDYALVIGINRYPGPTPAPLKAAEADAQAFYNWLIDPNGGALPPPPDANTPSPNATLLLASKYPPTPPNQPSKLQPMQGDIDDALYAFGIRDHVRVGRRFYFYFSGHGTGLSFEEVAMLLPGANPDLLSLNLGLSAYRKFFREAAPFDEVVIFLDCCRDLDKLAVARPPGFTLNIWDERVDVVQDFIAFAARLGKKAYEPPDPAGSENRGLFTAVLLEGLRGAKVDQRGNVTASTLRDYLKQRLPEYAQARQKKQSPDFGGNATDLVFCNVAHTWPEITIDRPAGWAGEVALLDGYNDELFRHAGGGSWTLHLREGVYDLLNLTTQERQTIRVRGGQASREFQPVAFGMSQLVVEGPHDLAELTVIDESGTVRARELGKVNTTLPEGRYRVDAALADGRATHSVTLTAGLPAIIRRDEWPDTALYSSAAPVTNSRTTHEHHRDPAVELSQKPTWQRPGVYNSRLFLFIRNVDDDKSPVNIQGLSLFTSAGALVTDFREGVIADKQNGYVAFTADLDAGPYLLAYRPNAQAMRTQPLWLSAGMETQVFIPRRQQLYLDDLFLSMAYKGAGFQPFAEQTQAVEVVLDGLQRGQNLAKAEQIHQLLISKFDNPWLGILAVHALRLDPNPDWALIELALGNLMGLVGADFPDWRALALKPDQPILAPFSFPPMLRAGLQLILHHSARHATTIPADSLTDNIYEALLSDSPWTAWSDLAESRAVRHTAQDFVQVERVIKMFDQRNQTVQGSQTNIIGDVKGPMLTGNFHGPVTVGDISVGNVSGSGIAIGHGARATVSMGQSADPLTQTFSPLEARINTLPVGPDKEDALNALNSLRREAQSGSSAERARRYLTTLEQLLPGFTALATVQFVRPNSGVNPMIVQALSGSTIVINTGSGAVATQGGVAAGAGGVAVGGSVQGNIAVSQPASPAETQVLQKFAEWIKAQPAETVSMALGLPLARVQQALPALAQPDVVNQALGRVEASILSYLWERFEFETLKSKPTP